MDLILTPKIHVLLESQYRTLLSVIVNLIRKDEVILEQKP